jgi:hypothetical protein
MSKDLDQDEWYFEKCPLSEAFECCSYEYARESEFQKRTVANWRRAAKGNNVEDYLELSDGIYDPPPGTGTYAYFPSWPDDPFLSVPRKTRKLWYEALGLPAIKHALFDPPIEVSSWDENFSRLLLENFERTGQVSCDYGGDRYVVFNISWSQNDQILIRKFRSWLKKNRPVGVKPLEMRGRGNPGRPWLLALKHLTCYRLLQEMPIYEAIAFVQEAKPKLRHYQDYQSWKTAAKRATAMIESFEKPRKETISQRFLEAFHEDFPQDFPEI